MWLFVIRIRSAFHFHGSSSVFDSCGARAGVRSPWESPHWRTPRWCRSCLDRAGRSRVAGDRAWRVPVRLVIRGSMGPAPLGRMGGFPELNGVARMTTVAVSTIWAL